MGSCGLPVPGLTVRLIDPASGRDVEPGQEGELARWGPNVMKGYHRKPAETAAALRDGWYYTGDLARSDLNGFLTITGRPRSWWWSEHCPRGGRRGSRLRVCCGPGLRRGGRAMRAPWRSPRRVCRRPAWHDGAARRTDPPLPRTTSAYKVPAAVHLQGALKFHVLALARSFASN